MMHGQQNIAIIKVIFDSVVLLLLSVGPAESPPNSPQQFEAYCANPALVPPFVSRGAPRQTA
jgi:hypothetical protein